MDRATWSADGKTIAYLGVDGHGMRQVYRMDVRSGVVEQLTDHPHRIIDFAADGRCVLFKDSMPYEPAPWRYPVEPIWRQQDGWLITEDLRWLRERRNTYVTCGEESPRLVSGIEIQIERTWFAPQGFWAVSTSYKEPRQYVLVDLKGGAILPLPEAVIGGSHLPPVSKSVHGGMRPLASGVLWVPGREKRVILIGVRVPVGQGGVSSGPGDQGYGFIVEYDVGRGEWTMVAPMVSGEGAGRRYVRNVGWLSAGRELLLQHAAVSDDRPLEGTVYTRSAEGKWLGHRVDATVRLTEPPELLGFKAELHQDANTPPRVVVSDGRHERTLTEPDAALQGIVRARMDAYQWEAPDGVIHGGLTLPIGPTQGHPVPLVIQAYYYRPQLFLPDGPQLGVDATQTYAARGMAVLQMPIDLVSENEGAVLVQRVDAAISDLAQRGLIDPRRVGLVGFSRAGYQTYYAITHPGRWPLAAAACVDSFTGTYTSYLFHVVWEAQAPMFERGTGGSFWEKKAAWLKHETSFNVDRVQTPVLFTIHGKGEDPLKHYGSSIRETLGAFNRNKRPLEYLVLRTASHPVQRPLERLALSEAIVDWMAFWLQGYEDPDPRKAVQYARWRPMRKQQEQVLRSMEKTTHSSRSEHSAAGNVSVASTSPQ